MLESYRAMQKKKEKMKEKKKKETKLPKRKQNKKSIQFVCYNHAQFDRTAIGMIRSHAFAQ